MKSGQISNLLHYDCKFIAYQPTYNQHYYILISAINYGPLMDQYSASK